jgi:cysteine-rich repeat protein
MWCPVRLLCSPFLSSLWAYKPSVNQWKFVSGSTDPDQARSATQPSSRAFFSNWKIGSNLYVWGGIGFGDDGQTFGLLNDLWKYDSKTKTWSPLTGSSSVFTTVSAATNAVYPSSPTLYNASDWAMNPPPTPGPASSAAFWADDTGGLWLFGGLGSGGQAYMNSFAYSNELWRYSSKNGTWICLTGEKSIYNLGSIGSANTFSSTYIPSSRTFASAVVDATNPGNAFIFGGRFATSTKGSKSNCKAGQDLYKVNFNTCGDNRVRFDDVCDDGNNVVRDGCDLECKVETGWNCTKGSETKGSTCAPICGDGLLVEWIPAAIAEVCDDGNRVDNDGCSTGCKVESGYSCSGVSLAKSVCTEVCGDGVFTPGEDCDDGNTKGGDGCTADCKIEDGFTCTQSGKASTKCTAIVVSADDLIAAISLNPPLYSWVEANTKVFRAGFREDMASNLGLPLSLFAVKEVSPDTALVRGL